MRLWTKMPRICNFPKVNIGVRFSLRPPNLHFSLLSHHISCVMFLFVMHVNFLCAFKAVYFLKLSMSVKGCH